MPAKRPPNHVERLPNGTTVKFWDEIGIDGKPQRRRYAVGDESVPSISTIVGLIKDPDPLMAWAASLAGEGKDWRKERNKAAARGTDTHALIVRMLASGRQGDLSELPDEHRPYGQAAAAWAFERSPVVVEAEAFVADEYNGFAGRFDLLADLERVKSGRMEAERARVDFKTVSKWPEYRGKRRPPYPEAALQLSGYELAARYCGREAASAWLIVRLGPDGAWDETWVPYDPDGFLAVLAARKAKAGMIEAMKPKQPTTEGDE